MNLAVLLLLVPLLHQVPDVELDVGVRETSTANDGIVSVVHLKCHAGRCAVATFSHLPCPRPKRGASRPAQEPTIELFDASDFDLATKSGGWVELQAKKEGWTHEFSFKLRRDDDGRVWLMDFLRTSTLVDFTNTKSIFKYAPVRSEFADMDATCPLRVSGIPTNGLPTMLRK